MSIGAAPARVHRRAPERRLAASVLARCKSRLAESERALQMAILDGLIAASALALGLLLAGSLERALIPSTAVRFWITLSAAAVAAPGFLLARRHIRTLAGCPYLGRGFGHDLHPVGQAALGLADVDGMLQCAAEHIRTVFQSRSVAVFSRSAHDYNYRLVSQVGLPDGTQAVFERDSVLAARLRSATVTPKADLPSCESLRVRATGGALLAPVMFRGELTGFINLGRKWSGDGYTAREVTRITAIAGQLALAWNHVRLSRQEREDECARDIQQALLPREIPQLPGYEIATAWKPARTVSGDYFDVLALDANRVGLCIADVAGKGVPAALLMANMQAVVRAFSAGDISPANLCGKVNRIMSGNIAAGKFITFFYGVLDAADHTFVYTNAGHNPPLIVGRGGAVTRLGDGGPVLGLFPEAQYAESRVSLRCGDRLILFTDGLTDAGISAEHEFGEERVVALAAQNPSSGARALRSAIMQAAREFAPAESEDDITLIVVTSRGHSGCAHCPLAEKVVGAHHNRTQPGSENVARPPESP